MIIVLVALRKSVADVLLTEPDLSTFQAGARSGLRPPQSVSFPQSMSFATRSTPTCMLRSDGRDVSVGMGIGGLYDEERDLEGKGKVGRRSGDGEGGSSVEDGNTGMSRFT